MRILRVSKSGVSGHCIEPIQVTVPRTRMEFFQDDVYPATRSNVPALQSEEWFSGQTKLPELVSLQPQGMKKLSEAPAIARAAPKFQRGPDKPEVDHKKEVMNAFAAKMTDHRDEEVKKEDSDSDSEWD